jgi:hypothetical protein
VFALERELERAHPAIKLPAVLQHDDHIPLAARNEFVTAHAVDANDCRLSACLSQRLRADRTAVMALRPLTISEREAHRLPTTGNHRAPGVIACGNYSLRDSPAPRVANRATHSPTFVDNSRMVA